ncbi:MAG: hypothetical protein QOG68_1274, partial [Solirubrobacteraceae bacterium]|nr:hypothetical protein [Solirubrobacteraceae bacterium]
ERAAAAQAEAAAATERADTNERRAAAAEQLAHEADAAAAAAAEQAAAELAALHQAVEAAHSELETQRAQAIEHETQLLVRLEEALGARDDVEQLLGTAQLEQTRLAEEIEVLGAELARRAGPEAIDDNRAELQLGELRRLRASLTDELRAAREQVVIAEDAAGAARETAQSTTSELEQLRASATAREQELEELVGAARDRIVYLEGRIVELQARMREEGDSGVQP